MRNRKNEIAATIAHRIVDGTYPEGSALPTQLDLAAEFEASHTTVSAAKWFLTGAGVIRHGGQNGTQVPAGARDAAVALLANPLFT
jgi:DNA-binding GntR family transcriptional regulator